MSLSFKLPLRRRLYFLIDSVLARPGMESPELVSIEPELAAATQRQ